MQPWNFPFNLLGGLVLEIAYALSFKGFPMHKLTYRGNVYDTAYCHPSHKSCLRDSIRHALTIR